jgi:uncharacterized protein YfaS (alpha-2-macroglobulin family)/TolA-binding protein
VLVGLAALAARGVERPPAGPLPSPKGAVDPVAPELPAEVVAAMQDRHEGEAIAALETLARSLDAKPDDRSYVRLVQAIAQRLAGRRDEARATLRAAIEAAPRNRWSGKLQFELAAVELALGHADEAERISRAEVTRLLADDRKDRLAGVFEGFTERLLKPADPTVAADPEGAHALLEQARRLAKGEPTRARLLFAMARASESAGNSHRAAEELRTYLEEYPRGADRPEVRFHLGEQLMRNGAPLGARIQWADLARELEKKNDPASRDVRARALFQMAYTYGGSNHAGLAAAALRRMMAAEPGHPLAVQAAFEVGSVLVRDGRSAEALAAFRAFLNGEGFRAETDEARRERAKLAMSATYEVARILRAQAEYNAAIAAWKGYLAQYPDGPQSAEAQRAILETQLAIADDHAKHRRFAEARAVWQGYVTQNPLDAQVPQVLFRVGQSYLDEKKTAEAIAAWETLAGKFPGTVPAGHAQFEIARLVDEAKGDPAAAIERLKAVTVDPWQSRARERIAVMEARTLRVVTPRTFRSGEVPFLHIATRNLESLSFTAYKLDPEEYFRKKHALKGVEGLDIGLVSPDVAWTVPVPGFAKYRPVETDYRLEKLAVSGVWVVKVTDEKALQAMTLVLGSDLDAIVKASRDQVLVFAQDMKTGRGRAGARVLVSDGSGVILDSKTGDDGVVLQDWPKPRAAGEAFEYLILDGPDAAGSGLGISSTVAQGLAPRAFLYTDRPAYRPGQPVALRGIVREVKGGQYAHEPGAKYQLEVTDSRGRRIVARAVALSPFGTFHERLPLDDGAPVGTYRVRLFQPGGSDFHGTFEVQAYELAKVDLAFSLPRTVYYRGETIEADLTARYQYGTPLAARPIRVTLPNGRVIEGTTDAAGKFHVSLPTEDFAEEEALRLVAQLPLDNVEAVARVMLALRAFQIELGTARDVYLDGEAIRLRATTRDAQGEPTGQELSVALLKHLGDGEREVRRERLTTDPKTGEGSIVLKIEDADGGRYTLRASATDRFGNPVVADRDLTISGNKDETRLRLLADRTTYKVGETARVNLHNRAGAGPALLAWEAERILRYQLIPVVEGDNPIAWEATGAEFPNVSLTAARMSGTSFHQARLDLDLERDLRVTIAPARPSVGPGDEVEVEVTTRDQLGRPVAAELSLALVDRALLRLHGDSSPPIGPFFYGQRRTGAFTTEATNTFRYEPKATDVTEAVIVESTPKPVPVPVAQASPPRAEGEPGKTQGGRMPQRDYPPNRRILAKLEEPIPMSFPNETPLMDVLKYIKAATQGPNDKGIPIYVDPIGLREAEKTITSPVTLEMEDVPLRVTLRLMLKQIGMDYEVRDGLLTVTSESSHDDGDEVPLDGREPYAFAVRSNGTTHPPGRDAAMFAMGGMGMGGMGGMGGNAEGRVDEPAEGRKLAETRLRGALVGEAGEPATGKDLRRREVAVLTDGTDKEKEKTTPEAMNEREEAEVRTKPPAPRQQFIETAYWNPSVVTGEDGKARVRFRAPMALSEYRFTARGVTGAETLVGQAGADLAVRKDFFVDLKRPATLTQGDRPRFLARVHHRGVTSAASVRLRAYAGGREEVFPKTLDLKGDGVAEVLFEPFEVPDGENVRLTLSAEAGEAKDELVVEVPVRPWGMPAYATASGTSSNDATVFVGLPTGRVYESPEMLIVLSPSRRRMLIELALDREAIPVDARFATCVFPDAPPTTADRAADLLAAASAFEYHRAIGAREAPEALRLTQRIQELVAELVSLQTGQGGWAWIGGGPENKRPDPDRLTSARVAWALASAESLGLLTDPSVLDRATTYLAQEFAKVDANDYSTRAALLHALSLRNKATFEAANALNRVRQNLPDVALAYLALTLARLDHATLADEVLGVLGPRSRITAASPGRPSRRFWAGKGSQPGHGLVETTALAALAYARVRPQAPELAEAVEWLLGQRVGTGWRPRQAAGPALAALASFYGQAKEAEDRYRLIVRVNGAEVLNSEVAGPAEGRAVLVPRKILKVGDRNRVEFDVEGRGTFGYVVTMAGFTRDFGPDQNRLNRSAIIYQRTYGPADPELEGKVLPTGFAVAVNATYFQNKVTQVALGGRARVEIHSGRVVPENQPSWEGEYLILEEPIPDGTTLVEGSVQTSGMAIHHDLTDGILRFYLPPHQAPGSISYDVYGSLPGRYRVLPARLRSADDAGRFHLGPVGDLRVLEPGEAVSDPYRATPDELFARGKAHFDAGRLDQAAAPLEELVRTYTLRDDVLKDATRMLLYVHIAQDRPRQVVQDFEILREKAPELIIPFDKLLVIGRAYAAIGEHERAYLGWRSLAEASYLEDAQVGEVLRQRGRTLDAVAFLLDLWRDYPESASIESDFFSLAQMLASLSGQALNDQALRQELAEAGASRDDLLRQSIRLIDVFLALAPRNPLADEASLALVGDYLELEDYPAVVKLAARFAKLYPRSKFTDSFRFSEALGEFHLGRLDRAIEVARSLDVSDVAKEETPSAIRWQALLLLGQIHDARHQPAEALKYYRRVADRFTDASDAVDSLTRQELSLPEVSVIRPQAASRQGPPEVVALTSRNLAEADIKVYPVDLMRLYLGRRSLDAIARIDLAGIRPLIQTRVALGNNGGAGTDVEPKVKPLDLPLKDEGAYLVIARGGNLYASGIVLVSTLELEVRELTGTGRVRLMARDAATRGGVPGVQVRVTGANRPTFLSGRTDLRGVFVAEGLRGQVTAVARQGTNRYAFYRGPAHPEESAEPTATEAEDGETSRRGRALSLDEGVRSLNRANQSRQIERLQKRYQGMGGMGGMMGGGFR